MAPRCVIHTLNPPGRISYGKEEVFHEKTVVGLLTRSLAASFTACGKKAGIPVAGSATAEDMLTLIPKNVQSVFVIDVHRGMNIPFVDKALKTGEEAEKYKEAIAKIGLDPQKDVYFAAIGIAQTVDAEGKSIPQGAGVINLKYDPDKILEQIKKENPEIKEEVYEGVKIFTVPEKEGAPMFGAFLDASNAALGTEAGVKAVIDVMKGKAESVVKNAEIMKLVKTGNTKALVWNITTFTPEQINKMTETTPMLASLKSLQAATMYIDDKNKGLQIEIKALSSDAAKNKEIADMLTGFKALGAMGSSEKPEIGEFLNKIEISSSPDNVKLFVDMPEALLDKLGQDMEKQVKSKLEGLKPAEEPPTEDVVKEIDKDAVID